MLLSGIPTEQTYHFPVLPEVISTNIFHIVGKAFIKPQVIPPFHSDQVTKPLMRKLVRHNYGHILFVSGARGGRVTQHVGLAECEYSPVFHGSSRKIRHSNQVWWNDHKKKLGAEIFRGKCATNYKLCLEVTCERSYSAEKYICTTWTAVKLKLENNLSFNEIRTRDLCDTGAVLSTNWVIKPTGSWSRFEFVIHLYMLKISRNSFLMPLILQMYD